MRSLREDKEHMLAQASRFLVVIMLVATLVAFAASVRMQDWLPVLVIVPLTVVTSGLMLHSQFRKRKS